MPEIASQRKAMGDELPNAIKDFISEPEFVPVR
jgi:hypothetical protein